MGAENGSEKILRVYRSKEEAKESYDKMSGFYDLVAGPFERKYQNRALELLSIKEGETVLEIGFGTGHCLERIIKKVGKSGEVFGIDISSGMLEITRKRLEKAGLTRRVNLFRGDAANLPYEDSKFDAVFMSFVLELFDTPEIPKVLHEIKRVLKPRGRLGVVSMSKEDGESKLLKLYEWLHKKIPKYLDCRPIYAEQSIKGVGFEIKHKEKMNVFGLPGEIIVGIKRG
jgi:ubiquinone/menaquinone biosynthesis C-methylase UbiE